MLATNRMKKNAGLYNEVIPGHNRSTLARAGVDSLDLTGEESILGFLTTAIFRGWHLEHVLLLGVYLSGVFLGAHVVQMPPPPPVFATLFAIGFVTSLILFSRLPAQNLYYWLT
jgi:hypothetical protein